MALESTQPQTKISTFDLPFILLFYVRILVSEKIFGPHKGKQCEVTFVSHSHLQFLRHQRLLSLEPLCTNILCYVSPVAACLYSSPIPAYTPASFAACRLVCFTSRTCDLAMILVISLKAEICKDLHWHTELHQCLHTFS